MRGRGLAGNIRLQVRRQDLHIVEAINKAARRKAPAKLWSLYIGIHSSDDKAHIEQIAHMLKCKKLHIFDAKERSRLELKEPVLIDAFDKLTADRLIVRIDCATGQLVSPYPEMNVRFVDNPSSPMRGSATTKPTLAHFER